MDPKLSAFLERAEAVLARLEPLLPATRQAIEWDTCLAARWQRDGRTGYLLPLDVSLEMRLTDLIGVDKQLDQLGRNTKQFLDGLPANHALLWGSRGTGKSSLIRALLAEYAGAGLRLIKSSVITWRTCRGWSSSYKVWRSVVCCFAMTCLLNRARAITGC